MVADLLGISILCALLPALMDVLCIFCCKIEIIENQF
jgi:hypothetical protein